MVDRFPTNKSQFFPPKKITQIKSQFLQISQFFLPKKIYKKKKTEKSARWRMMRVAGEDAVRYGMDGICGVQTCDSR